MWQESGKGAGCVIPSAERNLWISIDGEETREGVPLQLLSAVFSGVQETIYHIAMAESGRDMRSRARVPDGIRTQYQLIRVAEHNSVYTVEAAFSPSEQAMLPFAQSNRSAVLDKYTSLLSALSESKDNKISVLFPDTAWRRRILRSVENYCPKKGDQWHLSIGHKRDGTLTMLSPVTRDYIGHLLVEPGFDDMTVNGELMRVHLDEHKIGIYYQPTGRVLDCYYHPDLEDLIVENLKGIMHVTGRIQLDANGLPDKIMDVTDIRPLDLRPLMLKAVKSADETLVFKQATSIEPSYEDDQVVFEVPNLHVVACGDTRENAVEELFSDLIWLWKEYALAPREELSRDAAELAERLRSMVEEAPVANG